MEQRVCLSFALTVALLHNNVIWINLAIKFLHHHFNNELLTGSHASFFKSVRGKKEVAWEHTHFICVNG